MRKFLSEDRFRFGYMLVVGGFRGVNCHPQSDRIYTLGQVNNHDFFNRDVRLAGTLVLPAAPGPHAAVVLLHGSGPQKRDLFMARWFAEQGIAALAYDKRGVGESAGDF